MQNIQLIIFSRAPLPGKVKKRIAKVLGKQNALSVHNKLFSHTLHIAETSGLPYKVYLSEAPVPPLEISYKIQEGSDLGKRMLNCFTKELTYADKVCLIGSDCLELTVDILTQAFAALAKNDVVFGPAHDGGYYLVGMKTPYPQLFAGITWGSDKVLADTRQICIRHNLSYHLLPTLNDIDHAEDIPPEWL